jgi:hypothetical protein
VEDPEVMPIFADSEWPYVPVCFACGTEHDYVMVIKEEYTVETVRAKFTPVGHDGILKAIIGNYRVLLAWDDLDPENEGHWLEWQLLGSDAEDCDGERIDGPNGNPDWSQVAQVVNANIL